MKHKKAKIWGLVILLAALIVLSFYLKDTKTEEELAVAPLFDEDGRMLISTTLFPVYDFAKNVGGEKVKVTLILPPGGDAHSFIPTEKESLMVKNTGLLLYTSDLMEPWLAEFLTNLKTKLRVVAVASDLVDDRLDPHVWLDFSLAAKMVEKISQVYQELDPVNQEYYQEQTKDYLVKLESLDQEYQNALDDCEFKGFIAAGHDTFSYLANRYNLDYHSAQDFIPTKEVDVERVLGLIKIIEDQKYPYIYYEELLMPHTAEIIRQQTGVKMLALNAAHNVGRYDIESGISFLSIMKNNLLALKFGLKCR